MASTSYYADIQKLYVAYFNRPADVGGLLHWQGVLERTGGDLSLVSNAFAGSQEYKDVYAGKNALATVAAVYQNLFGHTNDLEGMLWWAERLADGRFTVDVAVTAIAAGAQGSDLVAYNNKVKAAQAFTGALDTMTEITGYDGLEANARAKVFLSGVTTDASLAAAIAPAALNQAILDVITPPSTLPTFTLTASNASIDEGKTVYFNLGSTNAPAGAEFTYKITGVDAADVVGGLLTGTVKLDANGKAILAVSLTADASTEGLENLVVELAGKTSTVVVNDSSTTPVAAPIFLAPSSTATSIDEGQSVTFVIQTANVAAGSFINYSIGGTISGADIGNAPISGVAVVDANGRATVTITASADQLTEAGAETVTFSYVNPVTGLASEAVSVSINDTSITPNRSLLLTSGADTGSSFVGGSGDDTFNGMASANLLGTADILNGGDGIDTVSAQVSGATVRPNLVGIEVVSIQATGVSTVDLSNSTGVTTLENIQSTSALTFNNVGSGVNALNVRLTSQTTNVNYANAALAGAADVLNVSLDNADSAAVNVNSTGTNVVEVVNVDVVASNVPNPTVTIGGNAVGHVNVTSSLDGDFTIVSTVASIDASTLTGAVSLTGGATAQSIVTGAGADTITGGVAADTIVTGAGADVITGGTGADSVNAGEGNDTINAANVAELAADAMVDGGAGTDRIVLADVNQVVTDASLANVRNVETLSSTNGTLSVTLGANAAAAGLVNIVGGAGVNTINTSAAGYTLNANITAGASSDVITTGTGNDTVTVGGGTDTVTLGAGNDVVIGGANIEETDVLTGGAGTDELRLAGAAVGVSFGGNFTGFETITVAAGTSAVPVAGANNDTAGVANNYTITLDAASVVADATMTVDASALRVGVVTGLGTGDIGGGDDTTSNETLTLTATAAAGNLNVIGGAAADVVTLGAGNDTVNAGAGNDTISGGNGTNVLNGEAGNDSITGGTGVDTINGGAGNDVIVGTVGADVLLGGEGNDSFRYDAAATLVANASVDGGEGTDTIVLTTDAMTIADANLAKVHNVEAITTANGANVITLGANAVLAGITNVTGGTANDNINTAAAGYTLNAVIVAGAGDDTVQTGAGADTVTIGSGTDSVVLGAGNDVVIGGNNVDEFDVLNGGAGTDELRLNAAAAAGTNVSLSTVTGAGFTNFETITLAAGSASADNTAPTADVEGSTNSYVLTLGAAANVAAGQAITIDAGALRANVMTDLGADNTFGGTGGNADQPATNETLTLTTTAVAGNVNVIGGAAADTMSLGVGDDTVNAGAGNDVVAAGNGANLVNGDAGNDVLSAGSGVDTINGGVGNDTITGGAGRDILNGGDGNDVFVMTANEFNNDADVVDGGAGTDAVQIDLNGGSFSVPDVGFNGRFANTEALQFGNSSLTGGTATMTLGFYSQNANITSISSTSANALLNINAENYTIGLSVTGNAGNDTIAGGSGNDTLTGGAGNDSLTGNAGDDMFTLGTGTDTVLGGAGNDIVTITGADLDATDVLNGGAGTDELRLSGNTVISFANFTAFETITLAGGTAATDNATGADVAGTNVAYDITLAANSVAAADTLVVNASALGGIVTGLGVGDMIGGSTDAEADTTTYDTLVLTATAVAGKVNVTGGAGADNISLGAQADTVNAGAGNDIINGGDGANVLNGEAGNDQITGGAGVDNVNGGSGADIINTNAGADIIVAGEGADVINAGAGADTITLTEAVAARDSLTISNGESARLTMDVVNGFAIDTNGTVGLAATADTIDFGSAILVATGIEAGVVAGDLAASMATATSFLAALQLLENEFHNQALAQNGTVAFVYQGNTYVAEVTGAHGAELVTDIVRLVGVTGATQLIDADGAGAGTAVGLAIPDPVV